MLYVTGKGKIRQTYISKHNSEGSRRIADLLIIGGEVKKHYVAIKRLSALLRGVTSGNDGDFYCRNCLSSHRTKKARDLHYEACIDHDFCYVEMPVEGKNRLSYRSTNLQMRVPFVMYADMECILEPISGCDPSCACNDSGCEHKQEAFTRNVSKHVACGSALYVKFAHGEFDGDFKYHRGKDAASVFCRTLKEQAMRCFEWPQKEMDALTDDEKWQYRTASKCWLCGDIFKDLSDKVRDHCHYTGKFRGAAHSNCNLSYKVPNFIPVVFHNLSGYDAHIIIKELAAEFSVDEMGVIAENSEKYIGFSIPVKIALKDMHGFPITRKTKEGAIVPKTKTCYIRFIDSARFMQSSLDGLVNNLVGKSESLEELKSSFPNLLHSTRDSDERFKLFLRKGVYPYEYMDSFERFEEGELPPQEAFYSKLNLSEISDEDYKHAQNVWENIGCKDLGEYHDVYLCTDVLLLADVFENFRQTCHENYELDPAQFYTAPGLAWQAALKKTKVELELLTDENMLLMFEKGIRGGICQSTLHYAKANNKYMGEDFDAEKESSFLQYLDANNLYGWAMSQKLPTGGFHWVSNVGIFTKENIEELVRKDECGYILEVDIEYPKSLHREHNELPFLSEKMRLGKVEKLAVNLYDKEKYVVHIKVLKQVLEHGLVLKKVHRAIGFNQSAWLKEYIDFNTAKRMAAVSEFEKGFFKLMNNSVFGKTMENVRMHKDYKLACTEKKRKYYASKVNFQSSVKFSEKLMAMNMRKVKVKMNKPVYLGQAILDLSKLVMYEFHYDYVKPKYSSAARLMYMDTDSLVYHIKTDDFYRDIAADVESRFDTSGYIVERALPLGKNKKALGVSKGDESGIFKDECGGEIMAEFVGLRAKMYAYRMYTGKVHKRCKGTKKCVVKKCISFEDFKRCYETRLKQYRMQLRFASDKHVVYTQRVNKVALSADDDKRIQDYDLNETFAHGSSVGVVCKQELLARAWHPDRFKNWCLDINYSDARQNITS